MGKITVDVTRPFDLRRLTQAADKGGSQAEAEYALWHKLKGTQRLKRKYTHG